MIDRTLLFLKNRLDDYLARTFGVREEFVTLGPLSDADGKPVAESRNTLCMFLANIAEDPIPRGHSGRRSAETVAARPMHLDLYVMLACGHDANRYGEGLKQLSAALEAVQSHPLLTPQGAPDLPPGMAQLSIEVANLQVEQIGQLWGNLGGRYVPSVLFKVRSVVIDAGGVQRIDPVVTSATGRARPEAVQ